MFTLAIALTITKLLCVSLLVINGVLQKNVIIR